MDIKVAKNYINGEWVAIKGKESQNVINPSTGGIIGTVNLSTEEETCAAIAAAKAAFPEWRATPPVTRARYMFKLKTLLEERFNDLVKICSMEAGKTLEESRGEVRRGIEVVEVMSGIASLMKGQAMEDIAAGLDCMVYRQPLGVFAAVCPFNFPVMVPLWFLPPAIATGNTFVLKPSETVPFSMQITYEILDELNLPPGVVNLVNGGKDAVNTILRHPDVAGVSFVGSTAVAKYIYSESAKYGKRVQSLGGAKNFMLIMPDANIIGTANALMGSCFGCAGQRCLAGSNVVAVGDVHDKIRDILLEKAKTLKVGVATDPASQMGALVSKKAYDKVLQYIEIGIKEGAKLLLDGRNVKVEGDGANGYFIGPTIFDDVTPDMTIAKEEIFGPIFSIMRAKDFDEAMSWIDNCPYANAGSIFTASGKWAREFGYRLPASMCGVNIGIAAPMSFFSFGGARQSFFGDLKAHGSESIDFYTDRKVISARWF
jgi:malonate-semialdehyde dehydrogenase (acetylating)/methylmalonate-semialdehyde dehydrogenase